MTRSPTSARIPSHRILRLPASRALPCALALLAGAGFGASAWIAFGYYDVSAWGPLALVWLAVLLALVIATPAMPTGPSLAAVGGLLVLGIWSLLSTGWAESSFSALVDADRWFLYAGVLLALLLLLRGRELERP